MLGRHESRRGVALVVALACLALFSLLGGAYLRYMTIEQDEVIFRERNIRAMHFAEGFMRVAIADAARELQAGRPLPSEGFLYSGLNVYTQFRGADSLEPSESLQGEVAVRFQDESGKLNLNYLPRPVLRQALNIGSEQANRVFQEMHPRTRALPDPMLNSVEALVARGMLDGSQYEAIDTALFTVYTGLDGETGWLNVNTASREALALALGLDEAGVDAVMAARPFDSLEAMAEAAGKPLGEYPVEQFELRGAPPAFSVDSKVYTLEAEAALLAPAAGDSWTPIQTRTLQAVVDFTGNGPPRIVSWRRVSGGQEDGEAR